MVGFNWLFGSPEEQEAITSGAIYGPQGSQSDAAKAMASRMRLASMLGNAGMMASETGRKGGNFFDVLAATGAGLSGGGDSFEKSRHARAQAEIAAKHAAGEMTGGTMSGYSSGRKGQTGDLRRHPNGMVYEVAPDGTINQMPFYIQKAYTGVTLPALDPALIGRAGAAAAPALNPAQRTIAPQAAKPATPTGPPVGTVVDGWRFKGGNPNARENWEKV